MKEIVASSNISWFDYDFKKKELIVCFGGGSEYRYNGVREEAFNEFRRSDSKGRYFHKYIKDVYEWTDLTKEKMIKGGVDMARGKPAVKVAVAPKVIPGVNVSIDPIEKVAAVTPGQVSEVDQMKQVEKENVEVKAVTAQDVIAKVDGKPSGSDGVEPHQVHLIQDKKTIDHFRHGNP